MRKNGLPGTQFASWKLAQVSTTRNSPPKLPRCILAAKWRFEFGVTGYKFWNWYDPWNAISLLTAGNVQKKDPISSEPSYEWSRILICWNLQLCERRKSAHCLRLFLYFIRDLRGNCPRRQVYYSIVLANFWFPQQRKIQVLPNLLFHVTLDSNQKYSRLFFSVYLLRRRFPSPAGCKTSK